MALIRFSDTGVPPLPPGHNNSRLHSFSTNQASFLGAAAKARLITKVPDRAPDASTAKGPTKGPASINTIPNEIVDKIFGYLVPKTVKVVLGWDRPGPQGSTRFGLHDRSKRVVCRYLRQGSASKRFRECAIDVLQVHSRLVILAVDVNPVRNRLSAPFRNILLNINSILAHLMIAAQSRNGLGPMGLNDTGVASQALLIKRIEGKLNFDLIGRECTLRLADAAEFQAAFPHLRNHGTGFRTVCGMYYAAMQDSTAYLKHDQHHSQCPIGLGRVLKHFFTIVQPDFELTHDHVRYEMLTRNQVESVTRKYTRESDKYREWFWNKIDSGMWDWDSRKRFLERAEARLKQHRERERERQEEEARIKKSRERAEEYERAKKRSRDEREQDEDEGRATKRPRSE